MKKKLKSTQPLCSQKSEHTYNFLVFYVKVNRKITPYLLLDNVKQQAIGCWKFNKPTIIYKVTL